MIHDKVIEFGYGDVGVGANVLLQNITFQNIAPPDVCGNAIDPNTSKYIGTPIEIHLDYQKYTDFVNLLNLVKEKAISQFEFDGYTFDFTNFNIESVNVCTKKATAALSLYTMRLAC